MFLRMLKYELLRFKSIRSSWIWCIVILLLAGLVGFGTGWQSHPTTYDIGLLLKDIVTLPIFLLAIFCVVFTGMEYRHNTIRGLLVASNRRSLIFFTKWLYFLLVALIMFGLIMAVYLTVLTVTASFKDVTIYWSATSSAWFWRDVGRSILAIWLLSSIGYALAHIFRDYIVPIVSMLIVPLFLENILMGLTHDAHWTSFTPFRSLEMATTSQVQHDVVTHGTAVLVYTLIFTVLAYWRFTRRDMNN